MKCTSCEGDVFLRTDDLAEHRSDSHPAAVIAMSPVEDGVRSGKRQATDGESVGEDCSATKRSKAEAEGDAPSGVVNVAELTEGEYAVPDKYSRDPLGMGKKNPQFLYRPVTTFFRIAINIKSRLIKNLSPFLKLGFGPRPSWSA